MMVYGEVVPDGYQIHSFETLDSTNAEALRRLSRGEAGHGDVFLAALQTSGRGRAGRRWQSLEGNFHATFVVIPPLCRAAPELAYVVGLAVLDALGELASGTVFSLKWPNDVLCAGRKVAGILIEGGAGGYAAGIGVNLVSSPGENLRFQATSLAEAGSPEIGVESLLAALCRTLDCWYGRWVQDGFEPIRAVWTANAHATGDPIVAKTGDGIIEGRFEGLADDGALVLMDAHGHRHHVFSGDVSVSPVDR